MLSEMDIRSGNWLVDKADNNLCIVRSVTPTLKVERFNNLIYSPVLSRLIEIPITDDLISLCGFKLENDEYVKRLDSGPVLYIQFTAPGIALLRNDDDVVPEIEYIHVLQNAYFFLTGEELIINLFGAKLS